MKKLLLAAAAVLGLMIVSAAPARPEPAGGAPERFLVGFDRTPGAAERASIVRHGGQVLRDFSDIQALAIRADAGAVGALAREQGVAYVEKDELRYPQGLATTQLTPATSNGLYGLLTTKATSAQGRGWTGQGIKACVADTALDTLHPDIASNYVSGIDTVANDGDPDVRDDGAGAEAHGTHVAGTVLGVKNTVGVFGVAYNAQLHHARVLTNDGGYSSDIMDGVRWLVETAKCKVVNMSLGGRFKSRTEENFYKSMRSKGALIVAATGNDSANTISYPAGYAVNIAVGAVDRNNVRASFSNAGKNIDVSAPGVTVLSSVPRGLGSEASVTTTSDFIAYGFEYAGKTNGTTGTLVDCGLGQAGEFPAAVAGNIALIQRGTISFADKVTNAMNAGAAAVIIYNNAGGEFTGTLGAEGKWIPAVSVSGLDGQSLKTQVGSSAAVANQVSDWDHYDGTSMATPHVTGVLAQIWSVNSAQSNSTVESHLFNSTTDLGAAGYDTTYGRGLVNAEAAVIRAGG